MIYRRTKDVFLAAALIALGLALAAHPEDAARCFAESLRACYTGLLPSLFPFFVIGQLLVNCPGSEILAQPLRPVCRLLGLTGERAPLLLFLGLLGGYSALAAALSAALKRGDISTAEAERLLVAGVITSPGFAAAVGGNMLGVPLLGVIFYGCTLGANLLCGLGLRLLLGPVFPTTPPHSGKIPDSVGLGSAIASGANSGLAVCGCVVFFRMALLPAQSLPPVLSAALAGLAEVSSGCLAWSALGNRYTPAACCAAMSLLSLSVWCQLKALLGGRCSLRLLALTRPFHLFFSLLLLQAALRCIPGTAPAFSTLSPRVVTTWRLAPDRAALLFCLCCLTLEALRKSSALQSGLEDL